MKLEELEARVHFLEDRMRSLGDMEEIKALHRDYLFYISNLEFDQALECFAENIVVEIANYGRREGKPQVAVFFKDVIYQNVLRSRDAHFTCQPVITVQGDRARAHWMFYRLLAEPQKQAWVQGRYDCEYRREGGRWKFSFLKLTRPWPAFFGRAVEEIQDLGG